MLEMLRTFLSGKRLIVIAILLAIPFVFFGSTSFGTTFTSYGTVNGEPVTQLDVNIASGQVTQRLKTIYGEDFSLEDLDESVSLELIKNEVINQKIMFSQAKDLGLSVSLKEAKKLQKEEGVTGQKKVTQYTRYLTVVIAFIYGCLIAFFLKPFVFGWNLVRAVEIALTLTTGSIIILWLSELITEKGISEASSKGLKKLFRK